MAGEIRTDITPIKTDITSRVTQINTGYPAGAARRMLAQMLQDLVTKTGAVLDIVDVIDVDGKKISLKQFVEQADKNNDVAKASLLGQVCRDPKVISEEVIPKTIQYKADIKSGAGTSPVRITLNLKTAQSRLKLNDTAIPGQAPLNTQIASAQGRIVSETGKASDEAGKISEPRFVYSDAFVAKLAMEVLPNKGKA